jgi:cell surface protein SprA
MQMRNTDAILNDIPPELLGNVEATFNKNFNLNRQYSLLFDLSQSLRFDYTARMNARVDELLGPPGTDSNRREIENNLRDFGRPMNYHQTVTLNWQVPINKLPFMDFANLTATYNGDYDWQAPSLTTAQRNSQNSQGDSINLNFGNTIQNNQQIQLNSTLNFTALYNKVPYFKKALAGGNAQQRRRPGGFPKPGERPRMNNQRNEEEEEDEPTIFDKILMNTVKVALMIKSGSFNYSEGSGQLLPGFANQPEILGLDGANNNAPGLWFTVGGQSDIRDLAVANDWLVENPLLNNQYTETGTRRINARLTAEPINSLRIVVNAQQNSATNLSEFFRWNDSIAGFESQNTFQTQNFSTSWFMMGSAFENLEGPEYRSATYERFRENRLIISERLANRLAGSDSIVGYSPDLVGTPDSANYGYRYYSVSSQEVLIPAFLAAYSDQDVNTIELGATRRTPLPNWQISYDGLSKLKWFKKWFNSFTVNHAYRSTYTVSSITTNLMRQREEEILGPGTAPVDNNGDILPLNQINSITLSEQFAPLIGVNTKLKNNMTIRVEYKSDRNLTLSLTNNQITETKGNEWVVGAGYIVQDVKLKFVRVGARKTNPVSNLELRADLGIRDNITIIRRILEDVDQPTAGQRVTNVKVSADYQISRRVQTKLFYDLNMSRFKTSNAFPLTTNQFGISVRLNLGQ